MAPPIPDDDQVEQWLAESKSADGRRRLIDGGGAAAAALLLPRAYIAWHDDRRDGRARAQLLALARALRNACAAGAPAAAALMRAGAHCVAPVVAAGVHAAMAMAPLDTATSTAAAGDGDSADASSEAAQERALLLAACQLLANFSVASPAAAAALWAEGWPHIYQQLTATPDVEIQAAVTLAMLNAARGSKDAAAALAAPRARRVWLQLLRPIVVGGGDEAQQQAAAAAAGNDALGLLAKAVAFQHGLLGPLLRCLDDVADADSSADANSSSGGGSGRAWCSAHVAMLLLLAHEAAGVKDSAAAAGGGAGAAAGRSVFDRPAAAAAAAAAVGLTPSDPAPAAAALWPRAALDTVLEAAADVRAAEDGSNSGSSSAARAAPHVLEAGMQLLRALAQREDGGAPLCGGADGVGTLLLAAAAAAPDATSGEAQASIKPEAAESAVEAGGNTADAAATKDEEEEQPPQQPVTIVSAMLSLAVALGPPINPRRPDAAMHAAGRASQLALLPPSAAARAESRAPLRPPYEGYRSDLLCVLSNALAGRSNAQQEASAAGAAEVLMASTPLDAAAPLAREWALFGVAALCAGAGGGEARARLEGLSLQGVAASPELERMGVKVGVDEHGKLRVERQALGAGAARGAA